ncbi:MAG: AAA family ATPase [Candidatus Woesearchaeota archaeon]|nr:AAA family ATPase [Candidatus Woesearchaeota archaeon]
MKKEFKRIYIVGCSGSGKTSVAQELAGKLHIPRYDLDDMFWKKKYTVKRDEQTCRSMLQKIAKKDQWIIEGVYDRWVDPAFKRATLVIWLDISPSVITYRLIRRYLQRKKENKKEPWKDTATLIRYVWKYQKKDQPSGFGSHKKLIEKYKVRYEYVTANKQLKSLLIRILEK